MPRRSDANSEFEWTEETLARALAWWTNEGRSYRWIAAALGATPGQVSGMASRRCWPKRSRSTPAAPPIRVAAARPAPAPEPLRLAQPAPPTPAPPTPAPGPVAVAPPAAAPIARLEAAPATAIGLLAWRYGLCRWPINNPPQGQMERLLYCGGDIDPAGLEAGHVYCPDHHRAAHQHSKPSAKRELMRLAHYGRAAA